MIINDKRALAYIVTIDEIRPIPNYDRVEHARTNGWWCVTRLNELKVGDKAVYFEVDSKVPADDERFSFLEAKHYKIKTQKMCKVFSQGLLMPITLFPELANMEVGTDVTDILKVTYSVVEDNTRKSKNGDPDAKYKSMAQRHQKIFKKPIVRKIMKHKLGRKIMFLFFGKKKDKPLSFPTHFPFVHRTDEERCLIGDTKVQTNNGVLRIADIVNKELPVEVLSYNEKTKTVEYKPIISYQKFAKKEDEDLIEIKYPYRFGNQKTNTIRCTPDHKFYNGSTYVRADEIHQGDKIFIHHHCYDDYVIQVVFGMLLGDSSIYYDKRSGSNNIRIQTSQGEKQLDYLKMKQSLFGEQFFKIYKCKSGYCDNVVYKGCLSADYNISKAVLENCFINNKKTITPTMLKYITPLSLAIWYMDDGNLKHKYDSCSPSIIISTCGFSKNENELLIDMLRNNFGIECNLRREKNKYWSIYITTEGTKKFLKLITQYIPPCMRYKTLQEYENDYFSIQDLRYKKQERLMPIPVISIKKYKGIRRYKTVFDIEVKDNHNFFANNILTHNCENMPWVLGYERPLIVTEKLDGTSSTYILERKGKKKFEFYVLSRNVRQKTPDQKCYHDKNIYWDMAIKNNIEQHLKEYLVANPDLKYVCIQGESVGSVQGNPLKLNEDELYVFNFIRSDVGRLSSIDGKEIIESWGMKFVPILETEYYVPTDMEAFKEYATAKSVVNPNVLREGIVLRDPTNDFSFKNVSREYLLKHGG
ncbi:RNA ligase family protein [Ruminococcus sp.]|uniref:RNA ligase family protein n=1 Tax=Ruminococcus sp. TaxID=41978 RepID=UPI0025F1CC63|nr:RNA ligase family protein [Ruminococcus sp.]